MRATSLPILFCLPAGVSGAEFVKTTEDKCQRQADGVDFLSTRKLIKETKGRPDRLTETAPFTQVWKEENGHWRRARVPSYDHQLAEQPGGDK